MAEIINLNRYRKLRKKEQKRRLGAVNRLRTGRTKFEQLGEKFNAERRAAKLDGKCIEPARPKDKDEE